jgi:hypothetical protein
VKSDAPLVVIPGYQNARAATQFHQQMLIDVTAPHAVPLQPDDAQRADAGMKLLDAITTKERQPPNVIDTVARSRPSTRERLDPT